MALLCVYDFGYFGHWLLDDCSKTFTSTVPRDFL